MTEQELLDKQGYHLTLGKLKDFLNKHPNLPNETPIVFERIRDIYFTEREVKDGIIFTPWDVLTVENEHTEFMKNIINRQAQGEDLGIKITIQDFEDAKSQFISATCVTATELVVYIHGHY
jgi:sporulation-control protein spo0M